MPPKATAKLPIWPKKATATLIGNCPTEPIKEVNEERMDKKRRKSTQGNYCIPTKIHFRHKTRREREQDITFQMKLTQQKRLMAWNGVFLFPLSLTAYAAEINTVYTASSEVRHENTAQCSIAKPRIVL